MLDVDCWLLYPDFETGHLALPSVSLSIQHFLKSLFIYVRTLNKVILPAFYYFLYSTFPEVTIIIFLMIVLPAVNSTDDVGC